MDSAYIGFGGVIIGALIGAITSIITTCQRNEHELKCMEKNKKFETQQDQIKYLKNILADFVKQININELQTEAYGSALHNTLLKVKFFADPENPQTEKLLTAFSDYRHHYELYIVVGNNETNEVSDRITAGKNYNASEAALINAVNDYFAFYLNVNN